MKRNRACRQLKDIDPPNAALMLTEKFLSGCQLKFIPFLNQAPSQQNLEPKILLC